MSLGLPTDLHPALAPILNTVLDAVVVMSEDGRISAWNGVAEEIFGWPQEEAVGKLMSELVVPHQHRVAHEEGLVRLNAGGAPRVLNRRIEITALRKDGTEIPVELSITTAASGATAAAIS
jgi:PAS domain S-box-containing protein